MFASARESLKWPGNGLLVGHPVRPALENAPGYAHSDFRSLSVGDFPACEPPSAFEVPVERSAFAVVSHLVTRESPTRPIHFGCPNV